MKELSIKERAARYDAAIEKAKRAHNSAKSDKENGVTDKITEYTIQLLETIFPELAESEDAKIISVFRDFAEHYVFWKDSGLTKEKALAWLEKQQKASKVEEAMRGIKQKAKAFTEAHEGETSDEILAQMRGYEWSEEDERIKMAVKEAIEYYWSDDKQAMNDTLAWLEEQGEQKPTDNVEPKFKVGDIIKPKDKGHEPWQIMQVDILNKEYRFKDGYVVHFSQEDAYELVDKKFTAWSEEDENHVKSILSTIECCKTQFPNAQAVVEAFNRYICYDED